MKVICISGKAQHGKDTTAGYLKEFLEGCNFKVLVAHYGDLVKYICKTFFDWDGQKDEKGRSLLQYVGTDIIRSQKPDYWVDFILEQIKFFGDKWDYVLIPDCRFPNEVTRMREAGFNVTHVEVARLNFESPLTPEQQAHPSETAMNNFFPDVVIYNDQSLKELRSQVFNFGAALIHKEEFSSVIPKRKKQKAVPTRIGKDEYYLGIAEAVARRSTCIRRQYGAVIVKNDTIIATGYNGSARGEVNCCDVKECWRDAHGIPHGEQYEKCVAVHAEDNAISQAGREAIGATLYLVGFEGGKRIDAKPCLMCERKIKNAGIRRVVCGTKK